MAIYADLGAWALATLQATPAVTALVMSLDGTAQILEAGDVTASALAKVQEARRISGQTTRVLTIVVQDLGEEDFTTRCAVFVYDRYGYANIRTVREAIIAALVNQPALLVRDAMVNAVQYDGRSGHAIDTEFDLDIERINFSGALVVERDCYA